MWCAVRLWRAFNIAHYRDIQRNLLGTTPLHSQVSYLTGIQQSARVGPLLVHILLRLSDLKRVAFSIPLQQDAGRL